jgi:hypothetical protein
MAIVVYSHRLKRPRPKKAKPAPVPGTDQKPVIVAATGEKQLKRQHAERRAAEPREPSPEVDAFFARNVRPGGPLPPKQ